MWPETEQSWVSIVGLVGHVDKHEASQCVTRDALGRIEAVLHSRASQYGMLWILGLSIHAVTVTFHQSPFPSPYLFFSIQRKDEIFQKGNNFFHTISFYYVFIEFRLQGNMLARFLMLFNNVCFFVPKPFRNFKASR